MGSVDFSLLASQSRFGWVYAARILSGVNFWMSSRLSGLFPRWVQTRAFRRRTFRKFARPGLGAILILPLLAAPCAADAQPLQTSVPQAILIDADTQTVLFEKNADDPATPASTVKIMTAELVFQAIAEGHLKLDDEFPVSENAWRTGGALARGSTMFAALNSRIRVEDLIRGLVIVSGNDAAIVLAEGIAGSEGAFATRMTERARELGLDHLTFTNSWGRDDPEQKVTARDMALLAAHLIRTYPDLYQYFGEKDFTWNKIKQPNRNPLLTMDIGVGRAEDRQYRYERLWHRCFCGAERPAPDPRALRRQDSEGTRRRGGADSPMGIPLVRAKDLVFGRRGRRQRERLRW